MSEPAKDLKELRVLCVDDQPSLLSALRRTLSSDYAVVAVESAEEALAKLESGMQCDVIMTDTRMPGMRGPELLAVVQKRWPNMARVIMSGADQGEAQFALDDGRAHEFMAKPWSPGEPEAHIAAAIAKVAIERRSV